MLDKVRKLSERVNFVKTVSRPVPPLNCDILVIPIVNEVAYTKVIKKPFWYKNEICISGSFYDDLQLLAEEEKIISELLKLDKNYLYDRSDYCEKLGKELLGWCKRADKLDLAKITHRQISKSFLEYIQRAVVFVPFFTFTISAGNYLEREIKNWIQEKVKDEKKLMN